MDIHKIKLVLNTIKYLKFKQIYFRIFYNLRNKFLNKRYDYDLNQPVESLKWVNVIHKKISYLGYNTFRFLNITHEFNNKISWNYDEYGKLWTYNLNYFDFLNQCSIKKSEALMLIRDFASSPQYIIKDGLEPYPTSLRNINWIKYLSKENIQDDEINRFLFNQYFRLLDNLEYHLLGNHLLENGLSLLFGAYYFQNDKFYYESQKIISAELEEQITLDGAHFELSPMYHQIILERILDCISLVQKNSWRKDISLLNLMQLKASKMLGWLNEVTFKDGTIPMVNDSAIGIAPSTRSLQEYAKSLNIYPNKIKLLDSGYRKFKSDFYELFVDVGEVGPTYQPGHAHADTFNFLLQTNQPIIVDTGVSTYNLGRIREEERSSMYHNTVVIGNENSSEVWAGFRVSKRANVTIEKDLKNELIASHNGYENRGVRHTRRFKTGKSIITITDFINKNMQAQAHFHFHPNCRSEADLEKSEIKVDNIIITFKGHVSLNQTKYEYAHGFNRKIVADKVIVSFSNTLETSIKFKE